MTKTTITCYRMCMNIPAAIALARFTPFGPVSLLRLWRTFPNLDDAFHADVQTLERAGIDLAAAETFIKERATLDPDQETQRLYQAGVSVTALDDPNYPALLKEIPTPPLLLYHRGNLPSQQDTCVAIVGTRLATPYGKSCALLFARELARNGLVIVSGLAVGIDTAAHEATVEVGGRTIAVVAHGLHTLYPSQNRLLAERIISTGGAIVSEFPLGMEPLKQNFPLRNRIISGLSKTTLVVEGKLTSGALITAREALDQNRDVFAIPADISRENSAGPNSLLQAGAGVALIPEDILNSLALQAALPLPAQRIDLSSEASPVLDLLDKNPKSIDDVVRVAHLPASDVMSMLTQLELKQLARDVGGGMYIKL